MPRATLEAALPDLEAVVRTADADAAPVYEGKGRGVHADMKNDGAANPVGPIARPSAANGMPNPRTRTADLAQTTVRPDWVADVPEDRYPLLMELTIRFVIGVARIDGPIISAVREQVRQHVQKRFGCSKGS